MQIYDGNIHFELPLVHFRGKINAGSENGGSCIRSSHRLEGENV